MYGHDAIFKGTGALQTLPDLNRSHRNISLQPNKQTNKMASLFLRSVRATANPAFTTLRAAKTPTLRRFLATPAEQPRLRIGSEAPNFQAKTTAGDIDFHQWLDGKWAILFSHPADFTPVCTTELGAFAKLGGEFEKRGVKMIGLVSLSLFIMP